MGYCGEQQRNALAEFLSFSDGMLDFDLCPRPFFACLRLDRNPSFPSPFGRALKTAPPEQFFSVLTRHALNAVNIP